MDTSMTNKTAGIHLDTFKKYNENLQIC